MGGTDDIDVNNGCMGKCIYGKCKHLQQQQLLNIQPYIYINFVTYVAFENAHHKRMPL